MVTRHVSEGLRRRERQVAIRRSSPRSSLTYVSGYPLRNDRALSIRTSKAGRLRNKNEASEAIKLGSCRSGLSLSPIHFQAAAALLGSCQSSVWVSR